MDQQIINLYDQYTHSQMDRKSFMEKLAKLTGGIAMAMTLLPMLENNYASGQTLNDPDMLTEDITYSGRNGEMKAFLAKPKSNQKLGSVLVIHENRGLNPHIKEVTKRVADVGYVAMAPDALSPFGGTPADEDEARNHISELDSAKNLKNYLDGLEYLRRRDDTNRKTACIGFCWGGGLANELAVNDGKLYAAIAYYGKQPKTDDVPRIKAKIMLHYGGLDERINAGIPAYRSALEDNHIDHQIYVYKGANHAFNNDTSPTRYNEEAAKLAWSRTLDLLDKTIR